MEQIRKIDTALILSLLKPSAEDEKKVKDYYATVEKQERLDAQNRKQSRLEKSGVARRYWHESFETYIPRNESESENLAIVRNFSELKENDKVLLVLGEKGLGKTHLGAAIIRECGGKFISIEELIFKYEVSANFNAKVNREDLMQMYSSCKMLVIDEIGRSMQQDKENALLNCILRKRYENMLPTVLISNLSKHDLLHKVGEAVVDRLRETAVSVIFEGDSYRQSKRDVNL